MFKWPKNILLDLQILLTVFMKLNLNSYTNESNIRWKIKYGAFDTIKKIRAGSK